MIERDRIILLSQYNRTMNSRQYAAASVLTPEQLPLDSGRTLIQHLNAALIHDISWLKRFSKHKRYTALQAMSEIHTPTMNAQQIIHAEVKPLNKLRDQIDLVLVSWSDELDEDEINSSMRYRDEEGRSVNKNLGALLMSLFLHQNHHRGQISAMLAQLDLDFTDGDLFEFIPNE